MPVACTFAPLAPAAASVLAPLVRTHIEQGLEHRLWSVARLARHLRAGTTTAIAVHDSGRLAGFSIASLLPETAHLDLLLVLPAWRRQGLARVLMQRLSADAHAAGAREIRLELRAANAEAAAFYRAVGFREVARLARHYAGRETAIVMAKPIAP